jgi:hypothetical protein
MSTDGILTWVLTRSFCSWEVPFVVLVVTYTDNSRPQFCIATHFAVTSTPCVHFVTPANLNPVAQLGKHVCPLFRRLGQSPILPFIGAAVAHVLQQADCVTPFEGSQHDSVRFPSQHSAH